MKSVKFKERNRGTKDTANILWIIFWDSIYQQWYSGEGDEGNPDADSGQYSNRIQEVKKV